MSNRPWQAYASRALRVVVYKRHHPPKTTMYRPPTGGQDRPGRERNQTDSVCRFLAWRVPSSMKMRIPRWQFSLEGSANLAGGRRACHAAHDWVGRHLRPRLPRRRLRDTCYSFILPSFIYSVIQQPGGLSVCLSRLREVRSWWVGEIPPPHPTTLPKVPKVPTYLTYWGTYPGILSLARNKAEDGRPREDTYLHLGE